MVDEHYIKYNAQFENTQPLGAVSEVIDGNAAVDCYIQEFESTYGKKPFVSPTERAILKQLARDIGLNQLRALMPVYFKMRGAKDWYLTKGHDVASLQRDLNAVIAEAGRKQPRLSPTGERGARFSLERPCDRCFQTTPWTGYADELEKKFYCQNCTLDF